MMKTIRPCSEDDLAALQAIAYETYDQTFRAMNTAETMEAYLAEAFNTEKLLSELKNPDSAFYFLQVDQAVVGYLKLNEAAAQSDLHDPDGLEIERIYVRQQHQGSGYGRELLEFALEIARSRKKKFAWLGVWEQNSAAIAFYEKLGFLQAGVHTFRMGDELQSDYIMKKALIPTLDDAG